MSKVAVILSGCGYLDGSEIQESVLTLLALERNHIKYQCFAPNRTQYHTVNHITGQETDEIRNILDEASRIARGNISALNKLNIDEYDALILPGGYGVAKNLSSYAFEGTDCIIQDDIREIIEAFYEKQKPIGAICIAPMLLAKTLTGKSLNLTVGNEANCNSILTPLNANSKALNSNEICVDEINNIYTTPAYMNDESLVNIADGIDKLIATIARKLEAAKTSRLIYHSKRN